MDVVPMKGEVLGLENEWYEEGCRMAQKASLAPGIEIKVLFPPCWVASKLSAF